MLVRLERQVGRDDAEHRRDDVAGDGAIGLDRADSSTSAGSSRISSCASRSAAATASSPGSMRPPGKAIWPAWVRRCSRRTVRITPGSARSVMAISTAASMSASARSSGRSPSSGGSRGGRGKRRRGAGRQGVIGGSSGKKAPPLHTPGVIAAFGKRELGELVIDRAGELGFEAVADERCGATGLSVSTMRSGCSGPRITASPLSSAEGDRRWSRPSPSLVISIARKAVRFDVDVELFDRRDQHVAAVGLAPQDRREQPDHRRPADRRAFVIPGAVAGDAHARMAAALGIPLVDRRQPALVDQLLELGQAEALKVDRGTAFRAWRRHCRLRRAKQSSCEGRIASLRSQ